MVGDDTGTILALDVGGTRIGLALASQRARLASPYGAVINDTQTLAKLEELCRQEAVSQLVIGLPRGMAGQETEQTKFARAFGEQLAAGLKLPISWQDEAVTSVQAEAELKQRGKPYRKEDIDALAATYILEDYLRESV